MHPAILDLSRKPYPKDTIPSHPDGIADVLYAAAAPAASPAANPRDPSTLPRGMPADHAGNPSYFLRSGQQHVRARAPRGVSYHIEHLHVPPRRSTHPHRCLRRRLALCSSLSCAASPRCPTLKPTATRLPIRPPPPLLSLALQHTQQTYRAQPQSCAGASLTKK